LDELEYPTQQPAGNYHAEAGALQYQLENIDTVERIERIIKGEVPFFDKLGNLKWKKAFNPMINEKGVSMIRGYLTMYLGGTKTYALSDLKDQYISDEVIDIARNIKAELMDNWSEYEVKDYAAASFIINIVASAVHAVLKKGQDATYLKFLRTTQSIQEVQHHQSMGRGFNQPSDEKQGLFNMIFGRKKR